jgi:hypothetical protein
MATATASPETVGKWDGEKSETVRLVSMPVDDIEIPEFQREKKAHHLKIAGEFDRTAYSFPLIIDLNGRYIATDGQQRLEALRILGEENATVLLIEGVRSPERAAAIYLLVNRDRKNLNAFEKFVGAHASKDRGTLEIKKILDGYGLRVAKSAGAETHVPAGAVTSIYNRRGGGVLDRTLLVRELAWGAENARESREGKTLLGLSAFLASYFDRVDDNRLVDVLRKHHPSSVLSKVEGPNDGGSRDARFSDYIRNLYNKQARGKARL